MAIYSLVQKCSMALVLLAAASLAVPITTTPAASTGSGSGELEQPTRTLTPAQSANETAEEAELGGTPPNSSSEASTTSTGSTVSPVTGVVLAVVAESPHGFYECSTTTTTREAVDSFRKGLSLVIDQFNTRYLVHLVDDISTCRRSHRLSAYNLHKYPHINNGSGAQGLADSLGKIDAYAELVRAALDTNPGNIIMQALHDVLRGTVKDLYILLSPTYCANCIATPQCSFTIPRLSSTSIFLPACNLVSYISSTIVFELLAIEHLTVGRGVGLPDTREWLSTHVQEDSPAYNLLS